MKKIFAALSICMISNSFVAVHADTNMQKKHKKKHHHTKHHHHKLNIEKQSAAAPTADATTTAAKNGFLSNVSGNFDLTTNYVFRGISQNNNSPAVQGGLTYTFPIGIYLNVWSSNVNFAAPNGATATIEIDTIGGIRRNIGDNFTYDISMARYNYPRARDANYNELNTLFIYRFFQLGVSYSDNAYNFHTSGTYVNGTVTFDIPCKYALNIQGLNFQAEMGHYRLGRAAGNSYNDYSVTLNKKLSDTYTITAQWTGTNGQAKVAPLDDNQIIGTVTASF